MKTGTAAACYSDEGGRDIQPFLIGYVENFVRDAAGKRFNPHVTIGVGTEKYLDEMLAELFPAFRFSPAGASVYQLGSFGTARKELRRRSSAIDGGHDIQPFLISYIENFVRDAAGKRFNPHVTIGVGTEKYLNEMLAEPFPSFTFSPAGASVYQLGSFGTARKELKALTL